MVVLKVNKIKQILLDPSTFFSHLRKEKGIREAFLYFVICSVVNTLFGAMMGLLFQSVFIMFFGSFFPNSILFPEFEIIMFTFSVVGGYVLGIGFSFVLAGILHLWILLFGGTENYSKAYQLYVYSHIPYLLLGWIPVLGGLAWIYSIVLLVLGTEKMYHINRTKAILMYLIPLLVLGMLFLLLMVLMFTFFASELFSGLF